MGPPLARLPTPRRLLDPLSLHRRHPRYLDALTGGFFTVGLVAFCVSMFRKFRLLGARRAAEYVGPGLALTFLAHGSKGLRLPLFAGALYAYARLHAAAKTQSRALLTRVGQRVLEVYR